MNENKFGTSSGKEMVCVDTYRILDSCRDKDCYEDVRVYLTERGQSIIDHTCAVRVKSAATVCSGIDILPMPFNRGFYQLSIRLFIRLQLEACVAPGEIEEFSGITAVEKKVVLFGSEGNVRVFRSSGENGFCSSSGCGNYSETSALPIAVVETVDPLVLDSKIVEPGRKCCCCCCAEEIPDTVCSLTGGCLSDNEEGNRLLVSLGIFSVVRLERPAQYLVHGVEYCVPEKECVTAEDDDPCSVFRRMKFPVAEFCPPSLSETVGGAGCDCDPTVRKCCS